MKGKQVAVALAVAATFAAANAAAAMEQSLPPLQHQDGVAFVSGGDGQSEAHAFEHAIPRFPLALEFVRRGPRKDEFLAGANVRLIDAHGKQVLSTVTDGPFLLAHVPAGRYKVIADYDGHTLKRMIEVDRRGHRRVVLEWPRGA